MRDASNLTLLHPCAKLTHKIAAAAAAAGAAAVAAAAAAAAAAEAAAAAAAAKISARRRHGKKNQDFYENLENEKIAKNIKKLMKIDKNIDF